MSPFTSKENTTGISALTGYFASVARKLLRPSRGVLSHPSISASLPGATYSTHLWDWDTYWTGRGLLQLAQLRNDEELRQAVRRHLKGSLLNFLDHQAADGRISLLMTDAEVDPFGCLSGGPERNQAKPIMAQIALLASDALNDLDWLEPRLDSLTRFLDSWTRHYTSPLGLLVWGNDVTIGVDNDPTTFGRPPFSSANLLLNCLYHQELIALATLSKGLNRTQDHDRFRELADLHAASIQEHCWDSRDRFFYTVDVQCQDRRAELVPDIFPAGMPMSWRCLPLRIQMFTGFLPLWCGIATQTQADELLQLHLHNRETFNAAYGVRSLSAREPMYSLDFSSNPSNWLGPIWLLTNYFVWKGLRNYSFHKEAADLAQKTVSMLAADLAKTGTLHEYYHPDTGAPLSHAGFLDWNLLVLEMANT